MTRARTWTLAIAVGSALAAPAARAHSGPPFPMVEERTVGRYRLALWTDPDATDDGSPGGQFWIVVHDAGGRPVEGEVKAILTARPGRGGPPVTSAADAPGRDPSVLFARVVMDHEGPWQVSVALDGPMGPASLIGDVDATYDTRPKPYMLAVYALPFLAVGGLWLKAVRSRGRGVRR